MVTPKTRRTVVTKTDTVFHLTGRDILQLLVNAEEVDPGGFDKLEVTFDVPGGGDYSNMTLDMMQDKQLTVDVRLVRTTKTEDES